MASPTPTSPPVHATPPLPHDHKFHNLAPSFLIPSWILFSIAIALFTVRIRMRLKTVKRLYAEDYVLMVTMLVIAIEMPLVTVACHYGLGRHTVYVSPANATKALYYLYISIFPFYLGAAAARVSIALMLLRLKPESRSWKIFIWIIIVVQVSQGIFSTVIQIVHCLPIRALWAFLEMDRSEYKCLDPSASKVWGWVTSGSYIATDITLALLPLTLILPLRRSLHEKTLIAILMSLGLLASAASITKTVYIGIFQYRTPDILYNLVYLSIWSKMEEMLIAIAASAPTLGVPVAKAWRAVAEWWEKRKERRRVNRDHARKYRSVRWPRNGNRVEFSLGNTDEESQGPVGKSSKGIAETGEVLKPRWWALPNGFVHTDLITTIDLNQSDSERTRETTMSDGSQRDLTTTGLSSYGMSMGSLASSAGSSGWYGRSQERMDMYLNG